MIVSIWKTFNIYQQAKKNNFILHVFLEILQRYCKLVVFGTLGLSGYAPPKWYCCLVRNFCVYLQAKNQLHPPCFCVDIAKICKLILDILSMPVSTHPNDSITLWETSIFICIQKINCINHFFLAILKYLAIWLAGSILAITQEPKFCQICWSNINNNISSSFRLFPRKTNMTIFFKKSKKP